MKKILPILFFALMLAPSAMKAQTEAGSINRMWSYPVVYKYDEQVTWYFDLSTTTFAPNQDVYLWIWSPSEPDAGNFNNSSDFAKLTYVDNMVWSFTLTPTTYFSKTPAEIAASAGFWFRLKDDAGTMQSEVGNMPYTDFSSFYTANQIIRSYPEEPTLDGGVSILFNANLVPGFEDATSVHFHSGLNNWALPQEYQAWLPEIVEKTRLKNLGNGFWKMDLVPKTYYNAPDGFVMENITFLFVKGDWAGTSPDQIIYAAEYVAPPPPDFRFFPMQLTKRDFLGIIRKNNEVGVNKLLYTVTGGATTISGEIVGNMTEIKGFVNLVSAFQNETNLNEIHVLVKDNLGHTISDTTIPLKTAD